MPPMSPAARLTDADRSRFVDAVEASFLVSSRQQFFVWSQSAVQALIPHEILICGIDDGSRQGMVVHRFSASRYFRQEHFDAVADAQAGLISRLLAVAEGSRSSVVFSPCASVTVDRPVDGELLSLVATNELKNLAAQLVMGSRGRVEAVYGFSRLSVGLDTRLGYLIELVVPHLHVADLAGEGRQRGERLAHHSARRDVSMRLGRADHQRAAFSTNALELRKPSDIDQRRRRGKA